jgi:Fe-Mn family superoxide dismutase
MNERTPVTATAKAVRVAHFDLPALPYPYEALEPVISKETLQLHHDKHHKKYFDTMNELLEKENVHAASLEDVVKHSSGKLFNNAGQAWNHTFYWHSLSPRGGKPSVTMFKHIATAFGDWDRFAKAFATAANNQFGSGWAWLVNRNGKLDIMATPNAESPMAQGVPCLLALDVWEHAYYVDYRNQREKYVEAVINERLNWEFAEKNFGGMK